MAVVVLAVAVALGQDFSIFVPTICKVRSGLSMFLV
jgi:hypothetical protein